MSQPFRHRAALSLAALAVSAPLLAVGTAYADPSPAPTSEGGPVVEFTGGCLLLLCSSKPSTERLSVPAESTVTFVNGLGKQARLYLDGQAFDPPVSAGGAVAVRFNRGPVKVAMGQGGLGGTEPVTVSVVAAPTSSAPGTSAPGSPSSAATSPAQRGPAAAPSSLDPGAPGETDADPDGAAALGEDPDETGTPDEADLFPDGDPGAASGDGDSGPDVVALDGTADPSGEPAAEPLTAVRPVGDSGPTGLLALIATVCVVGVSAGAIRAIIAQRASRTRAA
jgi:hypothetical protein